MSPSFSLSRSLKQFFILRVIFFLGVGNLNAKSIVSFEEKENKNVSFWKAFREFSLADKAPEQYVQSSSADEAIELTLKTNPRLLSDFIGDTLSAQKYFSFYPLAMSSEFIYLNSSGNVYRVMVFDPSEMVKMKSGNQKFLKLRWKDPDTRYVHSMKASLRMVDPTNDNYESDFYILSYSLKKSFDEAKVELADGANASELVSMSLMLRIEDLSHAIGDPQRKNLYGYRVTKASFLKALERSKKFFQEDASMLKFLEKVSSGLTSLE